VPPPPRLGAGEDTVTGWNGGGEVNILEDARHLSVLHIRKYFVTRSQLSLGRKTNFAIRSKQMDETKCTVLSAENLCLATAGIFSHSVNLYLT
jgi:hypothetical protein